MRQRVFTVLAGASLVLCAATCVMWVRSYAHLDGFERLSIHGAGSRHQFVSLHEGKVWVGRSDFSYRQPGWTPPPGWFFHSMPNTADLQTTGIPETWDWGGSALGFTLGMRRRGTIVYYNFVSQQPFYRDLAIVIPMWFLALLTAIPPALWSHRTGRRRRRARRGLCPTCGYDLRATPGQCPECGGVAAAANA